MSKLIAENLVDAILNGDQEGIMNSFNAAMAERVSDALEVKKVELASTLIAPAAVETQDVTAEVNEEAEQIDESRPGRSPLQLQKTGSIGGGELTGVSAQEKEGLSKIDFSKKDAPAKKPSILDRVKKLATK
jgi:hypothetical protein